MSNRNLPVIPTYTVECLAAPKIDHLVILGIQQGDEGKGSIVRYAIVDAELCYRFNGGPNAGHTEFVDPEDPLLYISSQKRAELLGKGDIKFDTHQIPTGILWGVLSLIGYDCVTDLIKAVNELCIISEKLGKSYMEMADNLKILQQTHLILPEHVEQDNANNVIGTTGSGIGYVYAAKARRDGMRIIDFYNIHMGVIKPNPVQVLQYQSLIQKIRESSISSKVPFTCGNNTMWGIEIVTWESIYSTLKDGDKVVGEGAQAHWLDRNQGRYPFVTSSDCTIGAVCSYGFDLATTRTICVSKLYGTYVGDDIVEEGFDKKDPNSGVLELLRRLGGERGTTTGRRRQCYFINLNDDFYALRIEQGALNGQWFIKKGDIVERFDECLKKLQTYVKTNKLDLDLNKKEDRILMEYIVDTKFNKEIYVKMITRGAFNLVHNGQQIKFNNVTEMQQYILQAVQKERLPKLKRVCFHSSPASEFILEEH